jgi:3-hydroxybutyryl-CoA dehydrogenase
MSIPADPAGPMSVSEPIGSVMVAGSGVMGRGILLSFARSGFDCLLLTRDPSRQQWLPPGVRAIAEPPEEPPGLVVESIPEDLDLKRRFFAGLDARYGGRTILSSNTSSLPLLEIAQGLDHPEMFCGLHYFQPPEAFRYVELIEAGTDPKAVRRVAEALRRTGKEPVHLRRPVVGGLLNRLQHAMAHEAGHLLDQGVVDVETIDLLVSQALGPRMAVTGLLRQKDLSGLDIFTTVQRQLVPQLHHGATPARYFQERAAAGDLGVKTGRGLYDWSGVDVDEYRRRAADKLARILAIAAEP